MVIGLMDFLIDTRRFFWGIHILGVVFGVGGATVTDVMFVRFMENFRIERREADLMKTLSIVVWVGIGLLIVSGLALLLPMWDSLLSVDRFVMKMTLVVVIILNGTFLNLWIQPRMRRISFVEPDHELTSEEVQKRVRLRRAAFALGGISFVSWYGAFALAVLNMVSMTYLNFFLIYLGLLVIAVAGSQIHERHYRVQVKEELDEELLE